MDIEREEHKRCHVLKVSGRIDSSNAQQFEDALMEAIEKGHGNVVVNLSDVDYLSSAAIRALVAALKETRGRRLRAGNVVIAEPPPHIREIFTLTALDNLFTFYDRESQAIGSF